MFFKRRKGNRRFEREHMLDVKLRTREVRNARVRLAATALAISLGTVAGLYALWRGGEWALNRFVFENDAFAVTELEVETDGSLSHDQLRRWSGVRSGDNLLRLDLARIRRDLEFVPMIRSASVDRMLPHTLRVRVTERAPVAQVREVPQFGPAGRISFVTYYLDDTGFVLKSTDLNSTPGAAGEGNADLPRLNGFGEIELIAGRFATAPRLRAALRLISGFDNSAMAGLVDLESIDLSAGDQLVATTEQGSQITFGFDRIDEQLRRWRAVYDFGRSRGRAILSLDLSVSNNAPALWLEASAVPASARKVKRPPRNRKKNV